MTSPERECFFYVGTYSPSETESLFLCALNSDTGQMRIVAGTAGIENPSYLTVSPDGRNLYAVSEVEKGEIFAYSIDDRTKELHMICRKPSEGAYPCHLALTPDGKALLAANYGGGVVAFGIRDQGGLDEATHVNHFGSSVNAQRQSEPHPHAFVPSPDGAYLFVPDLGTDRIVKYTLEDGRLFKQGETELPPGTGPRTLTFHARRNWAYVTGELNSTVAMFEYEAHNGRLKLLDQAELLPEDEMDDPVSTAAHVAVSTCGRFVYASTRGHDSIVRFNIDPDSGRLVFQGRVPVHGAEPRHFAIVDSHLLVANQDSGNIVSFLINRETGELTPTGFELNANRPVCICKLPVPEGSQGA
ncbi:lactonase family protein [Saccharibacillus sp. CPCC 101409]|uniref:lactonase family protein n=1 Tax=Saccharibacillus sp. CPCC 101409 TaxID=3058041 RepID=UPI00267310E7|nr:lactonase family protein [Saccharibacillus sp. CPCC 101409]MDO3411397.1 lactonase family protein [Saccharibacillus sp. CPCC 101409]